MAAPIGLQGCLLMLPLVLMMTGSWLGVTASPNDVLASATGLGESLIGQVGQVSAQNSEAEASSPAASACPDTKEFHQQHSAIAFPVENWVLPSKRVRRLVRRPNRQQIW
ncbi:MAG: hypothetical protein ACOC07_20095 [Coleofasciculus sp.]|uniref:hypothetical protein n=1 Tax=Coleofasciculus sp. TaxID=3100458 RepID=UPI003A478A9B